MDNDIDIWENARQIIEDEKKIFSEDKYIQTGKVPHEDFNAILIPERIRGEYMLVLMPLILNLDVANELLKESYDIWQKIQDDSMEIREFSSYYYNKLRINSVNIIHILKHFMDMMLVIITQGIKNDSKGCDAIGKWKTYSGKSEDLFVLDKYQELFDYINDMENANKHHLISLSTTYIVGRDELSFYSINERKGNQLYGISARDIIRLFNDFYKMVFILMDNLQGTKH